MDDSNQSQILGIKKDDVIFKKKRLKDKKKNGIKIKIIFAVFSVFILFIIIFGVGIYKYNWNGGFTNALMHFIPYPSVIVKGKIIPYFEFKEEVVILNYFYKKQKELKEGVDIPNKEDIKNLALNKQIRNHIIERFAKENDIKILKKEIEEDFQSIVIDAGSQDEVKNVLKDFYGLNVEQFKERVLRISLMSKHLEDILLEHNDNLEIKEKIDNILKLAKGDPDNFEEIAKSYSQGSQAKSGGDLGYLKRGEIRSELEAVLFSLKVGEVSDLIETDEGWYILKADDKIIAGEKVYKVKARQILIKIKSLDDFIEERLENVWVWRWI